MRGSKRQIGQEVKAWHESSAFLFHRVCAANFKAVQLCLLDDDAGFKPPM